MIRRAVAAVVFALVALVAAWAWRAERSLGAPATRVELEVRWPADVDVAPAQLERAWRHRGGAQRVTIAPIVDRDGARVARVTVHGAPVRDAAALARAFERPGTVRFHWVVNDSELARRWFRAIGPADRSPRPDGVAAYADSWSVDATGDEHLDYFVIGPTPAAIRAALAEVAADAVVPPELALAFEHAEPRDDGAVRASYWRSYLIEATPMLDEGEVAAAEVVTDPGSGQPEVQVTLTSWGGDVFARQTARRVGAKLAIVVDGEIASAPVVQGAIRRGLVTITVGGASATAQEREAFALARVLGAGDATLPAGLRATVVAVHDARHPVWLVRGGLALIAGLIGFSAVGLLGRAGLRGAPWIGRGAVAAPRRWLAVAGAAAITVGLPLALWYAGRHVLLPGVDRDELDALLGHGGSGAAARAQVGVLALGIGPYLAAVMLVELVAMVVPGWRRKRLGPPPARAGIDLTIAIATVALALVQAWFVLRFLAGLDTAGSEVIDTAGWRGPAIVAALVLGTLAWLLAALLITRWGLGSGVLAVWSVPAVARIVERFPEALTAPAGRALALTALVAVGAAAVARLRLGRGSRLPWGGVVPVVVTTLVLGVLGLAAMGWSGFAPTYARLLARSRWLDAIVAIPVVGLAVWSRRRDWAAAPALVSLGFVIAVVLAPAALPSAWRALYAPLDAVMLGAALVELAIGVRMRLALVAPTAALVVHDVDRADRFADQLADAGIAHAVVGAHARALLRFVGAFAPVSVVVAAADARRAAALAAAGPAAAAR